MKKDDVVLVMDEMEHTKEETTRCCGSFGKICKCGGFMHYQPLYDGYFYQCEKCKDEEF